MPRLIPRLLALVLTLATATLLAQAPPRVTSLTPASGACDVDAAATTTLTVTFDRAMRQGQSVVGGGPNFPTITAAAWQDPKTFVLTVELQPDHDYAMGLNSRTFTNFRSRKGVALQPVSWSFSTLPTELPEPKQQKQRNQAALAELQDLLANQYSYYDLRVKSWPRLFAAHKKHLLAAPTDAAWARAAANMLEPTQDMHIYLKLGTRFFGVGRRAVDPLYRAGLLPKYVDVRQLGNQALAGRTADGIGYLMVATWTDRVDLDAVDAALTGLRDCKAMVIDARPNAGGSETLARRVAAWFVSGSKVYAKNRYRTGKGKNGFGRVLDRTIEGNADGDKRFAGPIAVLTSRYVMSSNEAFVLMLRQADDCVQIGQPTFGSSGNPKSHVLSNGVSIALPSWQALRLDDSCFEGEGIAPDVIVEASAEQLKTEDRVLAKALALLRQKIGK